MRVRNSAKLIGKRLLTFDVSGKSNNCVGVGGSTNHASRMAWTGRKL